VIVATGATVRLTGSGLGCHHWPGCQPNEFPAGARATTLTSSSRIASSRRSPCSRRSCSPSARSSRGGLARNVKVLAWIVFAGTPRPGAARRDHGLLQPESVSRHLAFAALARRSCSGRAGAARDDAHRARCGAGAARDRAARRRSPPCRRQRARRHGNARDRGGDRTRAVSRFAASARSSRRSTCTYARPPHSGSSSSCLPCGRGVNGLAIRGSSAAVPASSSCLALKWRSARRKYRNGLPWGLVLVHVTVCRVRLCLDGRPRGQALAAGRTGPHVESLNVRAEHLVHAGVAPAGSRPPRSAAGNDGGQGASLAAGYLAKQWAGERFAEIDPEMFYDFQATRPHVSLEDGMTRKLDWPENGFFHAEIPGARRDAVILLGTEPNLRWKTFSQLVLKLATDLGVERVVTFGLAARRRAAHAAGAGHGSGDRRDADGRARARAVSLRGADRHRRRAARRVPRCGGQLAQPLGGGAALRLARTEPAGGALARPSLRRVDADRRPTSPSSSRPPTSTASR